MSDLDQGRNLNRSYLRPEMVEALRGSLGALRIAIYQRAMDAPGGSYTAYLQTETINTFISAKARPGQVVHAHVLRMAIGHANVEQISADFNVNTGEWRIHYDHNAVSSSQDGGRAWSSYSDQSVIETPGSLTIDGARVAASGEVNAEPDFLAQDAKGFADTLADYLA